MKLRGTLYRYQLPLSQPLLLGTAQTDSREGLIVALGDDSGNEGLGEIAPLPGFSRERLPDALKQAQSIIGEIARREWSDASTADPESSELHRRFDTLYHSVSFGFSTALLRLASRQKAMPVHRFVNSQAPDSVPVNALLSGSDHEILARAEHLFALGIRAAKLKVGIRPLKQEIEFVHNLRTVMPPSISLRLDANRRWTFEQASEFLTQTAGLGLEYIEEPVNNLRRLHELPAISKCPIAIDESLAEYFATGMQARYLPDVVVLKPTLVGSWSRCMKLRDWADTNRVKIVLSSAFESGVGLDAVASLDAVLAPDTPAGLDTFNWFGHDLIDRESPIRNGRWHLGVRDVTLSVLDAAILTEVERA